MDMDDSTASTRQGQVSLSRWNKAGRHFGFSIFLGALSPLRRALNFSMPAWPAKRIRRIVQLALSVAVAGLLAFSWISASEALMAAARTQIASDLVMHSQRLGKAAPNAIQGNPAAFRQLEDSREAINQQLEVLAHGGEWQGRSIPAADQALAEQIAAIRTSWLKSDKTAAQILSMEKELTGFRATLKTLNTISPVLLELSEQIASLLAQTGASPRAVAAAGQLVMLTQRLGKSANEFMTPEGINQDTAFLLEKDANTFRDILTGFADGSEVLRLPPISHPDARQRLSELQLQISDDGRGLDFERIRERATQLGVLDNAATEDESQLAELIFEPGLSTADEVTGLAGRGIGMDVVKAAVMTMGGALKVDSLPGAGTCVTLALPQLLSTQQVLVVADGGHQIAVPAAMVKHLMQLRGPALQQAMQSGSIDWQRQSMPLRSLADLFGAETSDASAGTTQRASVIVLRQLDQWLAVRVSEVSGHREVVVKQPGSQLAGVPGLSGATLQPDGSVLLIMNLLQLFDHHDPHRADLPMSSTADPISDKVPLVMVVDDSLTVRRVSQRLLEKRGYAVIVARQGVEALELLRETRPAALLLDIEMPRMDGFELLSRVRAHPRLKDLPVAMVTSRAAERHRQHAMQLGANAYFGKPYREQEVLDWLALVAPFHQSDAPLAARDEAAVA